MASGGLSPGDIASPIRSVLKPFGNFTVIMDEMIDLDDQRQQIICKNNTIQYDILILATGVETSYFGNKGWKSMAPGLKSIEDALSIRGKVLSAFEKAEQAKTTREREAWLGFVVVGGGPTGVELAGALGELAGQTLKDEFRSFDSAQARIYLVEGSERILRTFPAELSAKAQRDLSKLCVQVRPRNKVIEINSQGIKVQTDQGIEEIIAHTVLWSAGVKASPVSDILKKHLDPEQDRMGRIKVQKNLTIEKHPDIFVLGDLAHLEDEKGKVLPGLAPVAMQQGLYVGRLLRNRLKNKQTADFRYRDKGILAVIGRNSAVALLGNRRFKGKLAWLMWIFVHIRYLVEFDNQILVLFQWAWGYITRKRGARLITDI